MKVHSLTININKTHKIPSTFMVERTWDINTLKDFKTVIATLHRKTSRDGIGRILAYGKPSTDKASQKRLYVVKKGMGVNTELYENLTPQGALVKHNLSRGNF